MTAVVDYLSRFRVKARRPCLYLPDLTLWHDWHRGQGTMPAEWEGFALAQIAGAMGLPAWQPVRPWRVTTPGVEISRKRDRRERTIHVETTAGAMLSRWTLGPDGDWWQTEYPVKSASDLPAVLELVQARTYALKPDLLARAQETMGEAGILALEIPRRPYSDLLHDFLGWGEGLMLQAEPIVQEILDALDGKLQGFVAELAPLTCDVVFSSDNLDGQFISPRIFKRHLAASYGRTAEELHGQGKGLLVHVGGPVRHLLAPMAQSGVDGLEGISGPPQSDATLLEARDLAGEGIVLWGGIPQGYLQETYNTETFEAAVEQVARQAVEDERLILGVADRVPVDANLDRLKAIPALVTERTWP